MLELPLVHLRYSEPKFVTSNQRVVEAFDNDLLPHTLPDAAPGSMQYPYSGGMRKEQDNRLDVHKITEKTEVLDGIQNQSPLYVSTPSSDDYSAVKDVTAGSLRYLSRKAKRLSRLYTDVSVFDRFEPLEIDASLLDYLVRHGAISLETSEQILLASPSDRKSLLLMSFGVSSTNDHPSQDSLNLSNPAFTTGVALLVNALRHTGHHSLASQLDLGRRITPSPGAVTEPHGDSSSNDHRRRGQLSLWIQLEAIKVSPEVFQESSHAKSNGHVNQNNNKPDNDNNSYVIKDPLSINAIIPLSNKRLHPSNSTDKVATNPLRQQSKSLVPSSMWLNHDPTTSPVTSPTLSDPVNPAATTKTAIGCFSKFFRLFSCRHRRKSKNRISHVQPLPVIAHWNGIASLPRNGCEAVSNELQPSIPDSLIAAKLAILDTKSCEFYRLLSDCGSPFHEALVKYFEQCCGVLVLDCSYSTRCSCNREDVASRQMASNLRLLIVATQTERIKRLWTASKTEEQQVKEPVKSPTTFGSKLENELTETIIGAGVLGLLRVQDLRLSVHLDEQEVELAIDELNDSLD